MKENKVPVLIVGAGPAGLLMALALQRYGINLRIIDKKKQRTQTSNALGIHARTLQLLQDLDLVQKFLRAGKKIHGAFMHVGGKVLGEINLTSIESHYNYALMLPQSETEKILSDALVQQGIVIEYNSELLDLRKNTSDYSVRVQQETEVAEFNADYVIACDGVHSAVRDFSSKQLTGKEIATQFVLADLTIKTDLSLDHIHAFYSREGLLAIFPLASGAARLIADLSTHKKMSLESVDFANILSARSQQSCQAQDIVWKSCFWIHSKVIDCMSDGHLFFVGDAAHVHSPVGGQGMNTGMQDAYNLAWKLAYVIHGKASSEILASYHQERHPIAVKLVKETDRLTRMMLSRAPWMVAIRRYLLPILLRNKKISCQLANDTAMLSVSYPKSDLTYQYSVISNAAPNPGDLLPDSVPFNTEKYCLYIFMGQQPLAIDQQQLQHLVSTVHQHYGSLVTVCILGKKPDSLKVTAHPDLDWGIHQRFRVIRPALCLVRPDRYIAYLCNDWNISGLMAYCQKVFAS